MFHKRIIATILAATMLLGLTACGGSDTTATNADSSTTVSRSVSSESSQASESTETIVAKRSIMVEDLTGDVTVNWDGKTGLPAKGELLESGQQVVTGAESDLTLLLDSDKHVYAGTETVFTLVAEGVIKATRTRLVLEKGLLKSVIDNKLGSEESYEVETPNAVMAVRGTTFTVRVEEENGEYVTYIEVQEGLVEILPATGGETYTVPAGQSRKITLEGVKTVEAESRFKLVKTNNSVEGNPDYLVDENTYDENGYLIRTDHYMMGMLNIYEEYSNNEDGKPYEIRSGYGYGPLISRCEIEYDEQGRKHIETYYRESGTISEQRIYTYDENGNLILEEDPTFKYHPGTRTTYNYNEAGQKVSASQTDESGQELYNMIWDYDDEGRLSSYQKIDSYTGSVVERTAEYGYSEDGKLLAYVSYPSYEEGVADELSQGIKYTFEYDENGNKVKETLYYVKPGTVYSEFTYEYAEIGE